MLIDAHAHLTHTEDPELEARLQRAQEANVRAIINVCTDAQDLERGLLLSRRVSSPRIYTVASITPHDAAKEMPDFVSLIEQAIEEKSLVAIGETGLDYHYYQETKEKQKERLRFFIRLAQKVHVPIVIHCRDAFDDLFQIFDEEPKAQVMIHCFTGTLVEAEKALSRGWYLSFSGIVTYPKSKELQEVASKVPLDKILLETDSPYLAPQKYRGRPNEPAHIVETARLIASLRNIPVEELCTACYRNTCQLFAL